MARHSVPSWPEPRGEPGEGPLAVAALREGVQAEDRPRAGELDERDALLVAGLEADRGAGGHVQAHAEREGTIEPEGSIHFEKLEKGPDLYQPAAGVRHDQLERAAPRLRHAVALAQQVPTRNDL